MIEKKLGIDLAGSERRKTGITFVKNEKLITFEINIDNEILDIIDYVQPNLICIDAPLSIPKGRKSIDDKRGKHLRECDKILLKMKIKFFPITLGPMRILTKRAISLLQKIDKNIETIEVFPGALYDSIKMERKNKIQITKTYSKIFAKMNVFFEIREYSQDELDSIACFLTGVLYKQNKTIILEGKDGKIVIPINDFTEYI